MIAPAAAAIGIAKISGPVATTLPKLTILPTIKDDDVQAYRRDRPPDNLGGDGGYVTSLRAVAVVRSGMSSPGSCAAAPARPRPDILAGA